MLITLDHGEFTTFIRELGRYIFPYSSKVMVMGVGGRLMDRRGTHEISRAEKGKQPFSSVALLADLGSVERCFHLVDAGGSKSPVGGTYRGPVIGEALVTGGVKLVTVVESAPTAVTLRCIIGHRGDDSPVQLMIGIGLLVLEECDSPSTAGQIGLTR